MLYVFHVDHGIMLSFEMSVALETVQSLKETIERHHGIKAISQVLLVSGGEMLEGNNRVCSYSAGTDTNPIFMFSTSATESRNPPAPWPSIENENLKQEIDRSLDLPATYNTVVRRAQLAQQIHEMGREELRICERLVHEQHLQHQGWTAVIANMEDITDEFRARCNDFDKRFEAHIERRNEYHEFLSNFNGDLNKLARIPILTPLIQGAEAKPFDAFDEVYEDNESFIHPANADPKPEPIQAKSDTSNNISKSSNSEKTEEASSEVAAVSDELVGSGTSSEPGSNTNIMTLLQWISSSENQKALKKMAVNCNRELKMFDKNVMEVQKGEIDKTVDHAKRDDMKEIKGLEERLRGLEALMCDARKIVQEQNEMAQAFQQNQNRAANLGDASILPDLCASHRSQLVVMLRNHKNVREICNRCYRAKEELGNNLHHRLKFVIHIENRMYEIDSRLLFYHRCLRRLQKHLGIIEQIHQAPCIYVQAVTEVVRRRIFSSAFLMWASNLACHLMTIYNEEVSRRQEFKDTFDGHFLSTLFPGIDDVPPKYASEAPSNFDSKLPHLSKSDLLELNNYLPELTDKMQLPNLGSVLDFFNSRSFKSCDKSETDKTADVVAKKIYSHVKEYDRELESETDTEEYEKIQTSAQELKNVDVSVTASIRPETFNMSTSTKMVEMTDCETLTEDNLETTRLEVERLKNLLVLIQKAAHESMMVLKEEVLLMKFETEGHKQNLQNEIVMLTKAYDALIVETRNNERELVQRLTVDHELEMNDLKKSLYSKDDEIHSLKCEKNDLQERIFTIESTFNHEKELQAQTVQELVDQNSQLEIKVNAANTHKEAAIKELKEKLRHDYKNEMESLRCKFKLMTSMERSPSDTSLEKIERPDIIDIAYHETIISQLKDNFEVEKQHAIKIAIEKERGRPDHHLRAGQSSLEAQLNISGTSSRGSPGSGNQDIFRRILDEKERQLDVIREREQYLLKENIRLKDTIQSLTDEEVNEEAKERMESIQQENKRLEKDLEREKEKRTKLIYRAQNFAGVTINSCSKDDTVLVVWNSDHGQYTIIQDSPMFYFLHADSYTGLNLSTVIPNSFPRVVHCIGKVTDKEYCHAKKDENRYRVEKGTKFYRVKVRPRNISMEKSTSFERKKARKSSMSETMDRSRIEKSAQILIDSFAQTEMPSDEITASTSSTICHDMVDSGVDSQLRSIYKERNISVTEEDEPISLSDDRFRYKSVSEEEMEEVEEANASFVAPEVHNQEAQRVIVMDTASLDDSDEYRSLDNDDTKL